MQYLNRIRDLRMNAKPAISQRKLAEAIGISESALQNYEYGNRSIPGDVLRRLAKYFKEESDVILCIKAKQDDPADLYELKAIREASGKSAEAVAEAIGVSLVDYLAWEACAYAPRDVDVVSKIANELGVEPEALYGYDLINSGGLSKQKAVSLRTDDEFINVPLVSDIAAGTPVEPDNVEREIPVPQEVMGRHPGAFLLRIDGTSMDRVLPNGCYALVDPRDTEVVNGKIYAVKVNGDLATVKRVRRLEHGVVLEPDSASDPSHEAIVFKESNERYRELVVKGRVVWYTLPLDRDLEG